MTYLVTGGTGFIGRHLVERLLRRDGTVHVLVREGSRERLDALVARWGAEGRVVPVSGDLALPRLGVSDDDVRRLRSHVRHLFHLAAVYDLTAPEQDNERLNVAGTEHAVQLAEALEAGRLHHVSSIAVAGARRGLFREDMFDEGQHLPSAYHRTKFEAERVVRERCTVPWRVYRPAVVVGHSVTGEMDKVDGPYYFFGAVKRVRHLLPEWVPLIGPELGWTNVVPVDYVADALDHIAHLDAVEGLGSLDRRAFHLASPRGIRVGEAVNAFARAAHAPQLGLRVDKRLLDALPKGVLSVLMQLPALRDVRRELLADWGIPAEVLGHVALQPELDTRDAERALAGSGIAVPPLESYADALWDFWERHLDPDLFRDRSLRSALQGRTVVITGASSGIGRATALKVAAAGGIPVLVSRGRERLDELREEIEQAGGTAHVHPCDLADVEAVGRLVDELLAAHERIDYLVNNAGRSIRRSVRLSYDRFHDFERTMQLNYFGAIRLIMGLLPHMTGNRAGHVVNVSSIGVQTNPPRFSAYVASKAALDAFTRVVASEVVGDGVTFTTIHMPLVRTPMIAPTKIYDAFPAITPDEAADLVCEGLRARPKQLNTRLGTFGEVAYALAPKAVDRVLHLAYQVFPDSSGPREGNAEDEAPRVPSEARAMAQVLKGVHW